MIKSIPSSTQKRSEKSFNILNKKNKKGFTLIELMITVAIVGILAAVAIPAYQDYVTRSQFSEGLALASGAKPLVSEFHSNNGRYPSNNEVGFTGYIGKYISNVQIASNGRINAIFGEDANSKLANKNLYLTPTEESTGNLSWNCQSDVEEKYLPQSCTVLTSTNPGSPVGGGTYYGGQFAFVDGKLYFYPTGGLSGTPEEYDYTSQDENGKGIYDIPSLTQMGYDSLTVDSNGVIELSSSLANMKQKYYPDESIFVNPTYPLRDINGQIHNVNVATVSPSSNSGGSPELRAAIDALTNSANAIISNYGVPTGGDDTSTQPIYTQENVDAYNNQLQIVKDMINQSITNGEDLGQIYRDLLTVNPT